MHYTGSDILTAVYDELFQYGLVDRYGKKLCRNVSKTIVSQGHGPALVRLAHTGPGEFCGIFDRIMDTTLRRSVNR